MRYIDMSPAERKAVDEIWGGTPPVDLEVQFPRKPGDYVQMGVSLKNSRQAVEADFTFGICDPEPPLTILPDLTH